MKSDNIEYSTLRCSALTDEQIDKCKALFDNHYGKWDLSADRNPGKRIRFPKDFYIAYCDMPDAYVAIAKCGGEIVGQAFYVRKAHNEYGMLSWVMQLVVHTDYRRINIAKTLLLSIWGFSSDYMWGLATSNALTIKTLEAATLRKVRPCEMKKHETPILLLKSDVPFAREAGISLADDSAVINTNYPVDRRTIAENLEKYEDNWILGQLQLGQEWIAFTFGDQPPDFSDDSRNQDFFENSDTIVRNAYNRMNMREQPWAKYASHEIDLILSLTGRDGIHRVYDIGCGIGRHCLKFAELGYETIGFDYAPKLLSAARDSARTAGYTNLSFCTADCRTLNELPEKADLITCLYDVIGTFIDHEDNEKIIANIYKNLRVGGFAVISVMNLELTRSIAKHTIDTIRQGSKNLFDLKATNTMQKTGNVFEPETFLLEESTGVVYRKEQFEQDGELSAEYVIRDKRYSCDEICGLLKKYGFAIQETRYVQTGHWDKPLISTDAKAKEILVVAVKV